MEQINKVAEITLSYNPCVSDKPLITTSRSAFQELRHFFNNDLINLQEQFIVMYLNRGNRVLGIYKLSVGGITGTVADTRLILGIALKSAACSIILAHNHPSGNLTPSKADIDITMKIREAAALMDIQVLDHLIVSPTMHFTSMAEEGYYNPRVTY